MTQGMYIVYIKGMWDIFHIHNTFDKVYLVKAVIAI